MTEPLSNPSDPFSGIKPDKKDSTVPPRQVASFHRNSDLDSHAAAQHHTIGIDRNQASSGNHIHDGVSSRKLGANRGLTISGSKGGNAALTSVIALLANFVDFEDNTT